MSILRLIIALIEIYIISSKKLIGIIDLFRHGSRSPLTMDDNNIDILNILWNNGKGEMTNSGLRQEYLSGVRIKDTYIKNKGLFSEIFNKEEFRIHSTDVNRTIISAYARLLGIFPSNHTDIIIDNQTIYLPQIVPVEVIPYPSKIFQIDEIGVCKGFTKEFYNNKDNIMYNVNTVVRIKYSVDLFEKTIFEKLKSKLRMSTRDINQHMNDNPKFIYHIADALICAITENKDITYLGLSAKDLAFFKEYKDFFLLNGKRSDYELKIMAVPIYDMIIEFTRLLLAKESTLKYVGYSYHDKNLVTFFRILKLIVGENLNDITIPFASELIIEIYDDKTMSFILNENVLFNINYEELKLRRNSLLLSTDEFNNFCKFGNDYKVSNHHHNRVLKIFVFFIIFDCFLILILFALVMYQKKSLKIRHEERYNENMLIDNKSKEKVFLLIN